MVSVGDTEGKEAAVVGTSKEVVKSQTKGYRVLKLPEQGVRYRGLHGNPEGEGHVDPAGVGRKYVQS